MPDDKPVVIISCAKGSIVECNTIDTSNLLHDPNIWKKMPINKIDDVVAKRRNWVALAINAHSSILGDVACQFFDQHQVRGIVGALTDDCIVAVINKGNARGRFFNMMNDNEICFYGIGDGTKSPLKNRTDIYDCVKGLFDSCSECIHNIQFKVLVPSTADLHAVADYFKQLSEEDAQMEVAKSKATNAKDRTDTQKLIVKCYPHLLKLRELNKMSEELLTTLKRPFDDASIMPYSNFQSLQQLNGWTLDVETGETINMSVDSWLADGHFKRLALVFLGSAGTGKTPAGESLC